MERKKFLVNQQGGGAGDRRWPRSSTIGKFRWSSFRVQVADEGKDGGEPSASERMDEDGDPEEKASSLGRHPDAFVDSGQPDGCVRETMWAADVFVTGGARGKGSLSGSSRSRTTRKRGWARLARGWRLGQTIRCFFMLLTFSP